MKNEEYFLLPSEEIPDCCGSCSYIKFIKLPLCKKDDAPICVFGKCNMFERKIF